MKAGKLYHLCPLLLGIVVVAGSLLHHGIGRDALSYVIPLKHNLVHLFIQGHIPFWNILNGFGEPLLANPQVGLFYPATLLFLLPDPFAFALYILLHLLLFACGTRVYLIETGRSPLAAKTGAIVTVLSSPILSALDITFAISSLAYLPWVLLGARRRSPLITGVALILAFLAGEPMIFGILCLAALITWSRHGHGFHRAAGVILWVLLVLSPLLYLTGDLFFHSDRWEGLETRVGMSHALHPGELPEMLLGQGWGIVTREGTPFRQQTFLIAIYLGLFPLILTLAALRRHPVAGIGLVLLLFVAMGPFTPVGPLFSPLFLFFRYPAKWLLFLPFIVGILSAEGVDDPDRLPKGAILIGMALLGFTIPFAPHPERILIHLLAALLMVLILFYKPSRSNLLPAILTVDYLYTFLLLIVPLPTTLPASPPLPPLPQGQAYALFGRLQGIPVGHPPPSPLLLEEAVVHSCGGYTNLAYGIKMAGTPAPMQLRTYTRPKIHLPGVTKIVELDFRTFRRRIRRVPNPAPRVWGEGVKAGKIHEGDNGMDLTVTLHGEERIHLGVTYHHFWRARKGEREIPLQPDEEGFISFHMKGGEHRIVFGYHPPLFMPILILSILSLAIGLWYRVRV